jgi:D-alanine-D-alanine ligase
MIIALTYNIRHLYPDPDNPKSHLEADFDDPSTIDSIIDNLKSCGYRVIPIEANEKAYLTLYKNKKKINMVLNYSLGINGRDRYSHIPAMCEMLNIPYTGSSPLTQAMLMNKARAKDILRANNIPTLPYQLFYSRKENLNKNLSLPLLIKPVGQGSSAGITNKSIVNTDKELERQIKFIINTFNEPALAEPFLQGREFSVSMLGNPPKILPIIESDHSVLPKNFRAIDSMEVKWHFEEAYEKTNLVCPAEIKNHLRKRVEDLCYKTWKALNILDYCRIDIRCDQKGNPFILEINSPPGLIPPEISTTSYFPLAARTAGINFGELLYKIISSAHKRYST